MIFGDPQLFAISIDWEPEPLAIEVLRFCYWINGQAIGGGQDVDVFDAYLSIQRIASLSDRRINCALFGLDSSHFMRAANDYFSKGVYSIHDAGDAELDFCDYSIWAHHSLGQLNIMAVACDRRTRVLASGATGDVALVVEIPQPDLEEIFASATKLLERIWGKAQAHREARARQ
jgi:hypothetical protein